MIATCIQRGYIVEGGYRLEKPESKMGKAIIIYATSTKSALMKGIGESALPFYIVTINCKLDGSEEMGAINFRQMKEAVSLPFNTVYSKGEYDTTVVILLFTFQTKAQLFK